MSRFFLASKMNYLKHKLSAGLDFIRAERIYFLILLFTLAVIVLNHDSSNTPDEPLASQAVLQLEKASESFDNSVRDISTWVHLLETRPLAVLASTGLILTFAGLFLGGLIILILAGLIPRFYDWFQSSAAKLAEPDWKPVILFQVLVLIFSFMISSAVLVECIWGSDSSNENGIGLFHTLLIDLFACIAAYSLLRKDGLRWRDLFGKPVQGQVGEVNRGFAVYVAAFPVFVISLFLVLGISQWLHYEPPPHPLVKIFLEEEGRSNYVFHFALVLATIAAPIFEEIFFRGFCYRLFRSWWGAPGAMGISAALFAGIHGSGFAFFPIFILGFALAWLYEKRGNLTACWTFHVLHNSLFTSYFFVMKALIGNS